MSQIDDRIVALEFDNKQFESGAKQSLQTIENLKNSMKFDDMSKNLSDFSKQATKNFDLSKLQSGVETLSNKFSAAGIAGMEVVRRITDFTLDAGKKMASALIKPFNIAWEGGWARAANIDNAKFQLEGLGVAWKTLYDDIDYAVAGTAYGLDQAATAASQLTASGVKAGDEMKKALRGISGVAAMTNSTYDEISPIFTTVAGQGKLMTMQLRQLESRGLNAAASIGKAFNEILQGKYDDEIDGQVKKSIQSITQGKNVTESAIRDLVTKGKIGFKEFSTAMDLAFGEHSKEANNTFEGSLSNMQFALKKIGAEFAAPLREAAIPAFNKIRLMINEIKNNLSGIFPIFKDVVYFLSNMLQRRVGSITSFLKNDFTGAQNIANGLKNIVDTVLKIMGAIRSAFKAVNGPSKSMADSVNGMAEGFEAFTERLKPTTEGLMMFRNIVIVIINVVKNAWAVIKTVGSFLGTIAGSILKVVVTVGLFVAKLIGLGVELVRSWGLFRKIEEAGGLLYFMFEKIKTIIAAVSKALSDNSTTLGKIASGIKTVAGVLVGIIGGGLFLGIMKIIEIFKYLKANGPTIIDNLKNKFISFIDRLKQMPVFAQAFDHIKFIIDAIKSKIGGLINVIKTLFSLLSGGTTKASTAMSPLAKGMEILFIVGQKVVSVLKIIGTIAGGAFMGLLSVFNTIMSVVRQIDFGGILDKIKGLIGRIKDLELVRTAIDAFHTSGGNLIEVFKAVIAKIKEFFTTMRESGVSVFDFFIEKIKNVVLAVKDFFTSIISGKEAGGDALTRSMEGKASILDVIKEKFIKVKDIVVTGLAKMRDEGLLTKVLMVAYVLAILKALIQIPSSIHKVSKSLVGEDGLFSSFKNIAKGVSDFTDELRGGVRTGRSLLGSLKDAITSWGQAQKKSKIELLGELLRNIAISIGILAASLAVLTLVDTNKLKEVAIILGIFSAVLIAIAGAITIASKADVIKDTWFSSFAANMLAMTISIGILGGLLLAFSKIEIDDVWAALRTLGIVMLLMVAMGAVMQLMAGLDFSGTTLRSAIFMIAFALSIKSLAKTLQGLSSITIENPDSFMMAMIGLFGGMAVLIGVASAITPASALTVVALIWAISKVFGSFKEVIANINDNSESITALLAEAKDQIMVIVIFVSAMITSLSIAALEISAKLALAGASIGKGLLAAGAAFALFGVGLLLIQSALKKMMSLELFKDGAFTDAAVSLGTVLAGILASFLIVMVINKFLGGVETSLLKIAAAMTLMSIAMFNVSIVAHIVKKLEWEPILKALAILVAIMGMMSIVILASKVGSGSLGLGTVIGTIVMFTLVMGALIVLALMVGNDQVFVNLLKALGIITIIMLSMAAVLAAAGKIRTGKSWLPILLIIAMFGSVVAALYFLNTQITNMDDLKRIAGIAGVILGTILVLELLMAGLTTFAKKSNLGKSKAVLKAVLGLAAMLAAFVIVAGVLIGFAYATKGLDGKDLLAKTLAIIVALSAMTLLTGVISKATKGVKLANVGKFAVMMLAMIVAFAAVAAVVAVIGNIDMGNGLLAKTQIIALVLAELVGLTILMGMFGKASMNTLKSIGSLLLLTAVFGVLGLICTALNTIPIQNDFLARTQTIMLVLTELAAMNALLGFIGTAHSGKAAVAAVALLPLVIVFGVLGLICTALNMIPIQEDFLARTQTIMLVLVELAAINAILGLLMAQEGMGTVGALALLPLVIVFGILGLICTALNTIPIQEDFLARTQTIMLVLLELAAINALLGVFAMAEGLGALGALALLPLVAVFAILAVICTAIGMIPIQNDLLARTQTIMLVLVELAAINALLGLFAGFEGLGALASLALLPLIVIFTLLGVICSILSVLPMEGAAEKVRVVMNTLWEMAGMLAVLGIISPLAALAIVAIPGIISICLALVTIAGIIKLLENSSTEGMQAILDVLTGALWELVGIGLAATAATIGLVALGAAILLMGVACLAAGEGVKLFAEGIAMLASTTPQQMAQLQLTIETFCNSIAEGVMTIVTTTAQSIVEAVDILINGIIDVITGGISRVFSAGDGMGFSLYTGFKDAALAVLSVPGDILSGLIQGLGGIISSIYNKAKEVGHSIERGFRDALDWHSPPAFTEQFGTDLDASLQNQLDKAAATAEQGGEKLGFSLEKGASFSLEDAGKTITEKTGNIADKAKAWLDEKTASWNFDNVKQKGYEYVENLVGGLKMGEGDFLSEINWYNSQLGVLGTNANLAARGYSSTVADYKATQVKARADLIAKRNAIDYVNGTKAQREEYVKLNNAVGEYDDKIKGLNDTIGITDKETNKLSLDMDNLGDSFGKTGGSAGGASKQMNDFASKLEQTLEGQMNIFQKFEQKTAMSKTELLDNMRSQIKGMTEWAVNMQKLAARGIDQGLYQKLAEMGPQGAEYVGAFAEMTAEELAQANQLWAQSLVLPKQVAGQVAGAFTNIGQNIMAGEAKGIAAGKVEAINEAVLAQQNITDESRDAAGVQSPSWIFEEIGKFLMQGLANGIKAHGGEAVTKVKSVCAEIVSAARSALSPDKFFEMGMNAAVGLANGLLCDESKEALQEALAWIRHLLDKFKEDDLEEESPSKLTEEWGKYLSIGLANGIVKESGAVADALSGLVSEDSINAMRDTISQIGQMLADEVDDPVITPVLDLTNVQSGMRTLSNMFSTTQALNASASLNSNLQNEQLNQQRFGTTFIQNNYSPKALSRTEIYRQTKNQFSAYREAFQ